MKLITERSEILGLPAKLKSSWYLESCSHWKDVVRDGQNVNSKIIYDRIVALDLQTATKEDVTAVIELWWFDLKCDNCGQIVKAIVQLGEEPDVESSTANVCILCLKQAIELIEANQ